MSIYRYGNWGWEKLRGLCKITQPSRGRGRIQTYVLWLQLWRHGWQEGPTVWNGLWSQRMYYSPWKHHGQTGSLYFQGKKKTLVQGNLVPCTITAFSWQRGLCNSMKLWAMPYRASHPRQTGHSREFWQNVIHWRREWQTTPVYSLWELMNI